MRSLAFGFAALVSTFVLVACSDATVDTPAGQGTGTGAGTGDSGANSGTKSDAGGSTGTGGDDDDDAGNPVGTHDSGTGGGTTTDDAGPSGGDDASDSGPTSTPDSGPGTDGTPTRDKCTNTYGKALTGAFGRLDGYVVAIVVPASSSNCNGDSTHIHIQVSMGGSIYDVAVNVDGGYVLQKDIALPDSAWSEGWHTDGLDYSSTLGIHSTEFTTVTQSALTTELETALASANHITAYGTTYTGSDTGSGIHDIHFESTNKDGAIFLDPTAASAHGYFFHFKGDSF